MICELLNTEELKTSEAYNYFLISQKNYNELIDRVDNNDNYKNILKDLKDKKPLYAEVHLLNLFLFLIINRYVNQEDKVSKLYILENLTKPLCEMIPNLNDFKNKYENDYKNMLEDLISIYYEIKENLKFKYVD